MKGRYIRVAANGSLVRVKDLGLSGLLGLRLGDEKPARTFLQMENVTIGRRTEPS